MFPDPALFPEPSKAIQSDFNVIGLDPVETNTFVSLAPKRRMSVASKVAPPPLIETSASVYTSPPYI